MIKLFFSSFSVLFILACQPKGAETHATFTKADSLTESYLNLQDSLLQAWNVMINDDNYKLKKMKALLHELSVTGHTDAQQVSMLEDRIEQLWRIRYTQKTMVNDDVVTEYDFASNALLAEVTSLTESHRYFQENTTIQNLLNEIHEADQRVSTYRYEYDHLANRLNNFINAHYAFLKENDETCSLEKKPLFEAVVVE